MEARAASAEKQLAELNTAALLREAEAAVDGAIRERKIAPANRGEYLAFCATKEGLEKMRNIFSKSPAIIGAETQAPEGAPPAAGSGAALNAEQPVALVDFCATNNTKIPIIRPALAVCRVKKRLAVAFLGFYARSATDC
jgi:hypothetical protein